MRRILVPHKSLTFRHSLTLIFVAVFLFAWSGLISTAANSNRLRSSTQRRPTQRARTPQRPRIDYSQFSHTTHVEKQKLACDSCHKFPTKNWKELRAGDAAFPDVGDFPEHDACLGCHRQQFFARERPAPVICSNCHIAVTPRDTSRWLFPSLGDLTDPKLKRRGAVSEFGVGFPHDKHLEVVGLNRPRQHMFTAIAFRSTVQDEPPSCKVCHQTYQPQGDSNEEYFTKPPTNLGDAFWLKKGTFKTTPNGHTTCFTCHNADSGIPPDSKDCGTCHRLLPLSPRLRADFEPKLPVVAAITDRIALTQWRTRMSSGTYRHEGGAHPAVSCLNCHNVAAMNTLDIESRKVPVNSCGGTEGCHVTATTDEGGALNFEIDERKKDAKFVCIKCHITFGRDPLPENHAKAIPTPTPAKRPGA